MGSVSIRPISSGRNYRFYLEKESIGVWVGEAAEYLGLTGQVTSEEFQAVRQGLDPETGEKLRPIRSVDRVYTRYTKEGEAYQQICRARELYDITVSAPKSASIQGVLMDARVMDAHHQAVAQVRQAIEERCGGMVFAQYDHYFSRKLNPQIHTHLVAGNFALNHGEFRALDARPIFQDHAQLTECYRERLTQMLEDWGYKIAPYPEIAGVNPELQRKFSDAKGKKEAIDRYTRECQLQRKMTNTEIAVAMRNTRDAKPSMDYRQFQAQNVAKLTPVEHQQIERLMPAGPSPVHRVDGPWMAQSGGVDALSSGHRQSAWRSYQRWDAKARHSFNDYVSYVQRRWEENPGLLEAWKQNSERSERNLNQHAKLRLDDGVAYEPKLRHQQWTYGDDERQSQGVRVGF